MLNRLADIVSIIYILGATIQFVRMIIRTLGNTKVNRLNLKDGEVELKESKEDTSVFNKHMDEIVYFFEATDYNVVIIEDLDRFDNTDIFSQVKRSESTLKSVKLCGA